LAAAYYFRVQRIAAAMNARFDERLAERTRIARDLHDTLLQSIEGSRIVADDALKRGADPGRQKRALERLSGWLAQASEEGRSALSSLRSSTEEGNDLGQAFQRAGDEYMPQRPIEFSVSIEGTAEEMHPIVRDEVYLIGYESIRNACFHSGASRLTVELNYREGLGLRVRDNGKGMDPNLAAAGKGGHFGMLGMYERAARINGKLTISSSPANGTQVELIVPRSIAFHQPDPVRRSFSQKLTRLFKKRDRGEFL
jgi:signal transduction histidine kinase